MDIRFIKSLIAVVDGGSIAAAARLHYLTPAAVSQRIQALENDLGCELLIRSGHTVRPTEACLNVLPRARKLVREAEALRDDVDRSVLSGTLKIGAISTALTGLLPMVLRRLVKTAPNIVLQIIPGTSTALFDALNSSALDAAICVEPPFVLPKSYLQQTIRREPLLLLSKTAQDSSVSQMLSNIPYICYDSKSWGGRIAERYLADNQIIPRTLCELDALEAIQILVEEELGVSLVPYWSGLRLRKNKLTAQIIDDERYLRHIVLIAPLSPSQPAVLNKFRECLFSLGS